MRNSVLFILFAVLSTSLVAQNTFMKHYGGSSYQAGYSIKECFDGGYIACGCVATGANPFDLYVVRLDSVGDTLWTRKFATAYQRVAFDIIQTHDSGFVTCGYIVSQNTKLHLFKFDKNGDSLWSRQIGNNDWGQAIQERPDHGFMIAGSRLFRTDSIGNLTWSTPYPPFQYMYIEKTLNGGYAMVSSGSGFIFLTLVDAIGYLDTAYAYQGYLFNPSNNVICSTSDSGFVITGLNINREAVVIRIDGNGDTLWTRVVPSNYGAGVVQKSDGGYAVVSSDTNQTEIYLTSLDTSGIVQWTRQYNYPLLRWAQSMDYTTDGGFVLCGSTNSYYASGVGYDMLVIKTDSTGDAHGVGVHENENSTSTNVYPNPTSGKAEIVFDHQVNNAIVRVMNASGQLIKSEENVSGANYIFDGQFLPAGIYYVDVLENDAVIARAPLIIFR
jgi:hypothetical protein